MHSSGKFTVPRRCEHTSRENLPIDELGARIPHVSFYLKPIHRELLVYLAPAVRTAVYLQRYFHSCCTFLYEVFLKITVV